MGVTINKKTTTDETQHFATFVLGLLRFAKVLM